MRTRSSRIRGDPSSSKGGDSEQEQVSASLLNTEKSPSKASLNESKVGNSIVTSSNSRKNSLASTSVKAVQLKKIGGDVVEDSAPLLGSVDRTPDAPPPPPSRKKSVSSAARSDISDKEDIRISLKSFVQKHENVEAYMKEFNGKTLIGSGHYSQVFKLESKDLEGSSRAMKVIEKKKIPFNEKE